MVRRRFFSAVSNHALPCGLRVAQPLTKKGQSVPGEAHQAKTGRLGPSFETRRRRRSSEPDRKSSQQFRTLLNCLKLIRFFVMAGLVPAIHVFLA
jgi:hypothetical protein